jgi:hypothetical protein
MFGERPMRRNQLRTVAEGPSEAWVVWANTSRGVLDGVVERVLGDSVRQTPELSASVSAVTVMDEARATGIEITTSGVSKTSTLFVFPRTRHPACSPRSARMWRWWCRCTRSLSRESSGWAGGGLTISLQSRPDGHRTRLGLWEK